MPSQRCYDVEQNILSKMQLLDISGGETNLNKRKESVSVREFGLSLNIFLMKPGLGKGFFEFLFGLMLVFFH